MPRFSANLSLLFTEIGFLDRFAAAAEAGFEGAEFMFPYGYDKGHLADLLHEHGLTLVLHNLPAGDWAAGDRGIACLPDRVGEFRAGVEEGVAYATALGCPRLNCLGGIVPPDVDAARARDTLIANLAYAAERLAEAGIELLVEPVNTRDIPGFFPSRTAQVREIFDVVGAGNLRLQLDLYHTQVMEGDLAHTIETLLPIIGHLQVADNPGRHEPGTGEINFGFLFKLIDDLGYDGWIGCEYRPKADTSSGLGWLAPYLDRASRRHLTGRE
ncbi:MAG: hydroxypyruvate isomerase [Planctomycetaceae bacterium]|nr:hydroxypyruvate isomerase [Planctomycetaceae bacterium]MBV8269673.1 hydroxypyruvate isomerase [Planctomycetaceae bacterium]MBV8317979.1 hydroxypyruvate isomerase [Planctomycetaceae bacterium]MBV8608034.1 hydroxypyruvate isomerase [Singulisphaera sp.]